jgi:hypothetical protein
MGSYCRQGTGNATCTKQQLTGTNCTRDLQCPNDEGCNNGQCTIYFSLSDGTLVTNPNDNKLSVCSSGDVDEETNKCRTRTNKVAADVPCSSDCQYLDKEKNVTTTDPDACRCAMNASGKRYCMLASGIFKP